MGGGVCHQKNKERGAWYEIECVKQDIIAKEADGEDASFERSLLRAWSKYPGWEDASVALDAIGTRKKSKSRRVK